jgi:hypothetical protein
MISGNSNFRSIDQLVPKKVTYTYSGDGLKRREVFQTDVVTTSVWDGSEK